MEIKNRIVKQEMAAWREFILLQDEKFKDLNKEDEEKLTNSLIENNFIMTFHATEIDGKIYCVDGHQRIQKIFPKLEKMGYTLPDKFPTNFIDCQTLSEAAELVYVFNSKYAKIQQSYSDLFIRKFDLDAAKINRTTTIIEINLATFLNEIPEEQLDEVPPPPKIPISKLGDVFLLNGKHRVMCGDSTSKEDVEKLMDGKKADMVFTDPPYGNNLGYGRGQLGERRIINDENTKTILECIPVLIDKLKDNSHFLIFVQWRTYSEVETIIKNEKLKIRSVIVWDKNNAGLSGGGLAEQHEWIIVSIKGKALQRYYSGNLWTINREQTEREKSLHPHKKPIKLLTKGLDLCVESGTIILDLFLGSGSTLIACEQTNRICYGMEIDPIYIDVILNRYHKLYPDKEIKCLTRKLNMEKIYNG